VQIPLLKRPCHRFESDAPRLGLRFPSPGAVHAKEVGATHLSAHAGFLSMVRTSSTEHFSAGASRRPPRLARNQATCRSPRRLKPAPRRGLQPLKQRAKLADVLHVFDTEECLDQFCAGRGPEHGSHQLPSLRHDLIASHRITLRTKHRPDVLGHTCPVRQNESQERLPCSRIESYLGAVAQDDGILHARLVVGRPER
jgi:hypothetical protein